MEEPRVRAGLTIRQRTLLRDMVIPADVVKALASPENTAPESVVGEAARVLDRRGVLLWAPGAAPLNSDLDPSDLAPPAWVMGCFDEESERQAQEVGSQVWGHRRMGGRAKGPGGGAWRYWLPLSALLTTLRCVFPPCPPLHPVPASLATTSLLK